MMLMLPVETGVGEACGCAGELSSLPSAESPLPPSFSTVAFSCVTRVPDTGVPMTMARRMVAIPGTVTVLSMLLTVMSSAQACLSGKTRMTICSVCEASNAAAAFLICVRYSGGPETEMTSPAPPSVGGSCGEKTADFFSAS